MVHTIPVVTHGAKINRDSRQSSGNGYNGNQSNHLFAQILESAVDEQTKAPAHCHTVTYGEVITVAIIKPVVTCFNKEAAASLIM